jgi:hypothetical protein
MGLLFTFLPVVLTAQTAGIPAQESTSVKRTKTDNTFANTTEIHKKETASDEQILNEISDDFGLGDVVRITVAPPPSPPTAVITKTSVLTESKKSMPSLSINSGNNVAKDATNMTEINIPNNSQESKDAEKSHSTEGGEKAYNFNINENEYEMGLPKTDKAISRPMIITTKSVPSVKAVAAKTSAKKTNTARTSNHAKSLYVKKSKGIFSWLSPKKKSKKVKKNFNAKEGRKYGCYKF